MNRVLNKRLFRFLRLVQISLSQAHGMNEKLPSYIYWTRLVVLVHDEHFIVMDRLADANGR
ncbi:hypothetical protein D3C81_1950760 [compost metagenome]